MESRRAECTGSFFILSSWKFIWTKWSKMHKPPLIMVHNLLLLGFCSLLLVDDCAGHISRRRDSGILENEPWERFAVQTLSGCLYLQHNWPTTQIFLLEIGQTWPYFVQYHSTLQHKQVTSLSESNFSQLPEGVTEGPLRSSPCCMLLVNLPLKYGCKPSQCRP